jgi:very-short-patch-repair endonuclease
MREALTPAEAVLWESLRKRRLDGHRFRCQHPVGRFILDFYCPALRLAIEVDGAAHDHRGDYDTARTDALAAHGYRILRFRNDEVLTDLPTVLDRIRAVAKQAGPASG